MTDTSDSITKAVPAAYPWLPARFLPAVAPDWFSRTILKFGIKQRFSLTFENISFRPFKNAP